MSLNYNAKKSEKGVMRYEKIALFRQCGWQLPLPPAVQPRPFAAGGSSFTKSETVGTL